MFKILLFVFVGFLALDASGERVRGNSIHKDNPYREGAYWRWYRNVLKRRYQPNARDYSEWLKAGLRPKQPMPVLGCHGLQLGKAQFNKLVPTKTASVLWYDGVGIVYCEFPVKGASDVQTFRSLAERPLSHDLPCLRMGAQSFLRLLAEGRKSYLAALRDLEGDGNTIETTPTLPDLPANLTNKKARSAVKNLFSQKSDGRSVLVVDNGFSSCPYFYPFRSGRAKYSDFTGNYRYALSALLGKEGNLLRGLKLAPISAHFDEKEGATPKSVARMERREQTEAITKDKLDEALKALKSRYINVRAKALGDIAKMLDKKLRMRRPDLYNLVLKNLQKKMGEQSHSDLTLHLAEGVSRAASEKDRDILEPIFLEALERYAFSRTKYGSRAPAEAFGKGNTGQAVFTPAPQIKKTAINLLSRIGGERTVRRLGQLYQYGNAYAEWYSIRTRHVSINEPPYTKTYYYVKDESAVYREQKEAAQALIAMGVKALPYYYDYFSNSDRGFFAAYGMNEGFLDQMAYFGNEKHAIPLMGQLEKALVAMSEDGDETERFKRYINKKVLKVIHTIAVIKERQKRNAEKE